jgi:hypothetical protein
MKGGGIPGIPIPGIPEVCQHTSLPYPCISLTWRRKSRHTTHRRPHARHRSHRSSHETTVQIRLVQRVRLALGVVGVGYAVDDLLCLVARYLLVVGLYVAEVVAPVVVRFAHAHAVVREVHIAVVAEELRHRDAGLGSELVRKCGRVECVESWVASRELRASRILRSGFAGCRWAVIGWREKSHFTSPSASDRTYRGTLILSLQIYT